MKLSGAAAVRYCAAPDPARAGLLLFGPDAMRVALRRQQAIAALVGPEGEAEMRLTRMAGGDLRRDPALLTDALRAQGFFPGPRAVFVEEATDAAAPAIAAALADWRPGDAALVVTAGALATKSALRKTFEGADHAVAIGIYDDPPGPEEIRAILAGAGLTGLPDDAMEALTVLARTLDPGDFRQTVEKIGLFKHGDTAPLSPAEIASLAPATIEAGVDDMVALAAERQAEAIPRMMQRLAGQGVNPVTLCLAAERHFRALHALVSDPGGPGAAIGRLRPPLFGPRRDRMLAQARGWTAAQAEQALSILFATDLALRSSPRVPAMAILERALVRLAMLRTR
ncbi:MAG: DNA polymerase III subunit delta [Rhodobacteraceae bacterium]|nr:DNA polymerase III subunit delta [Paracoccaceae bacterium]